MKNIFKKSNIPFIKRVLHEGVGRDNWNLVRRMQERDGVQHQLAVELSLLRRGAEDGDIWSCCELARYYFNHCGDLFLPEALRFWKKAALTGDAGAQYDLTNLPIYSRILSYRSQDGDRYTAVEMQCALLTEWHLTGFGLAIWELLPEAERKARCVSLITDACRVLRIPSVITEFVPGLTFNGAMVDGLAGWDNKITVRAELLYDIERLVEVVFHELGHMVTFEIMRENENSAPLKALYGITDERVASWRRGDMGYEVPTGEEDPDTLSYGVYTLWAAFFLPR